MKMQRVCMKERGHFCPRVGVMPGPGHVEPHARTEMSALLHAYALMKIARHILFWCWLLWPWSASPGAPGGDWPMFRGGPALTGIATGSVPDHLQLLWTFKTGGPVKSSPAIVGGRVFIGSADGNLYALALADGTKAWAFKTGGEVESSPLVLEGRVYVGSSDGFLYALDAATGKLAWKYETGDKILGAPNWTKAAGGGADALRILVGSYDNKLHCVIAATGRSNWVYETSNYINGSPAVADGQTAFGGCDGLLHVLYAGRWQGDQASGRGRLHCGVGRAGRRAGVFRPV